jgi:hypothetical protein
MPDLSERDGGAIHARVREPLFGAVESWRRRQEKIPPRAEAVRQLIERGLAAEAESTRPSTNANAAPVEGAASAFPGVAKDAGAPP